VRRERTHKVRAAHRNTPIKPICKLETPPGLPIISAAGHPKPSRAEGIRTEPLNYGDDDAGRRPQRLQIRMRLPCSNAIMADLAHASPEPKTSFFNSSESFGHFHALIFLLWKYIALRTDHD
jgi:hypothetical protein